MRKPHRTPTGCILAAMAVCMSVAVSPTYRKSSGRTPMLCAMCNAAAGSGLRGNRSDAPSTISKAWPGRKNSTHCRVNSSGLLDKIDIRRPRERASSSSSKIPSNHDTQRRLHGY
ncbi:MAG TPA: hypothetical protein VGI81_11265 [Tepidisphaeraceae bacterium]